MDKIVNFNSKSRIYKLLFLFTVTKSIQLSKAFEKLLGYDATLYDNGYAPLPLCPKRFKGMEGFVNDNHFHFFFNNISCNDYYYHLIY